MSKARAADRFVQVVRRLEPEGRLFRMLGLTGGVSAQVTAASKMGTWGLDASTEQTMRERHRWFVTAALARLGSL